ncbi:unnamed protein product [Rotaria socialis]|uniref:Uncharacterized protein n=2 Tax=Rotaria socialis TaxID=392032 RepID=A0A821XJ24_9BILA|nr:unnamed protein product [Rotaria socialis]
MFLLVNQQRMALCTPLFMLAMICFTIDVHLSYKISPETREFNPIIPDDNYLILTAEDYPQNQGLNSHRLSDSFLSKIQQRNFQDDRFEPNNDELTNIKFNTGYNQLGLRTESRNNDIELM